jgi:hypothetical protein
MAADILEVSLTSSGETGQVGGQTLRVDTQNLSLPSFRIDTLFPSNRLGEIAARLKAIHISATIKPQKNDPPVPNSGLERAILALTDAVVTLTSVVREATEHEAKPRPPRADT